MGHASPMMTATYARLHDATLRTAFEAYLATRVGIDGKRLAFDAEAPTADAEWVKQHYGRIEASLPNGLCASPPQQECPHPNACLTCPDFRTTVEFLPVHRRQADETRKLVTAAEQAGRERLADNHRRVLGHLERIIPALESLTGDGGDHDDRLTNRASRCRSKEAPRRDAPQGRRSHSQSRRRRRVGEFRRSRESGGDLSCLALRQ